jgi:hypothetical protein
MAEANQQEAKEQKGERERWVFSARQALELACRQADAGDFDRTRIEREAELRPEKYLTRARHIEFALSDPAGLLSSDGKRMAVARYAKEHLTEDLAGVRERSEADLARVLELHHTRDWLVLSAVRHRRYGPPPPAPPQDSPIRTTIRQVVEEIHDKRRAISEAQRAFAEAEREIADLPGMSDDEKEELRAQLAVERRRLIDELSRRRVAL